jgi:hypothetical protein
MKDQEVTALIEARLGLKVLRVEHVNHHRAIFVVGTDVAELFHLNIIVGNGATLSSCNAVLVSKDGSIDYFVGPTVPFAVLLGINN